MLSIDESVPSFTIERPTTGLTLNLEVIDPEVITELRRRPPGEREDFAKAALRLGVLALGQAQGTLDAGVVRQQTENLLGRLEGALDEALAEQRQRLLNEFSLDNRSSVLCRLVREVGSTNSHLRDDLREEMKATCEELSLDNGQGGLSRLRREMLEVVNDMTNRNDHFQHEVRSTLEQMQVRRREAARSTRHGMEFEYALGELLETLCRGRDDLVEACGCTTGRIPRSKKGDFVITLSPDCAAAGARIVVEAKEQQGYSLAMALGEIEVARRNRDARVGLFVFSKRSAPEGLDKITRHGQDILVVWDQEDPENDVFLRVALSLARALSSPASNGGGHNVSLEDIDDAVVRVGHRTEEMDQLVTWAKTVEHNGLKIRTKAEGIKQEIEEQLERLMRQLENLRN